MDFKNFEVLSHVGRNSIRARHRTSRLEVIITRFNISTFSEKIPERIQALRGFTRKGIIRMIDCFFGTSAGAAAG
jgi:hypothetical protein